MLRCHEAERSRASNALAGASLNGTSVTTNTATIPRGRGLPPEERSRHDDRQDRRYAGGDGDAGEERDGTEYARAARLRPVPLAAITGSRGHA
jgi:hypothetical protein